MNILDRLPRRRPPADPAMWPAVIDAHTHTIRCGDTPTAALLVTGLPGEVGPDWLAPLLAFPGLASTAIHIAPVSRDKTMTSLRRKRARLESSRRFAARRQRLSDPEIDASAFDAEDLAARIATDDTRLFTFAAYLLVHADTDTALAETVAQLRAHAAAAGLTVRPASFRQLQTLTSVLPFGVDAVGSARTIDTDVIAAAFPFTTPDPPPNTGILLGVNLASGAPVTWDRFTQPNHNQVIVARSGAGKSFLAKTEIARWAYRGVATTIIDPDNEYTDLVEALGGTTIAVGADEARINPLDLPSDGESDAFTRRVMFANTVATIALGTELTGDEAAALDTAVLAAYTHAGITHDPATWTRPAPLMRDVHHHLAAGDSTAGKALAARLNPFITGGFNRLFNGPSTTVPAGHLVSFNLAPLPDELAAVGTLLVLDAAWRRATGSTERHIVAVDEAWLLLQSPAGAAFLSRLAKSARKHRTGLTVITQDAEDMLASELGRVVIANAATQILLGQAPQVASLVANAFGLTGAERGFVTSARQGEALLLAGDTHVAFCSVAAEMDPRLLLTGEAAA
ncbi:VirB4 family type IV secretion system protein [Phytomonospora endophytica]|uniref:Type IV secretory pathway VirB4 component n=1 Tax=Phytomonospora endophytica TaxID=714109 RepID=A0A841FRW9_9ACTN|nr:ATP-binding protein [Phytomonospora endophytica]MBB6038544.1 type IV secretory pathway VirB4 component [Phytomonospora endophytica]GIG69316.1 conjugal transfer protein [Phytomonospora endophytica]